MFLFCEFARTRFIYLYKWFDGTEILRTSGRILFACLKFISKQENSVLFNVKCTTAILNLHVKMIHFCSCLSWNWAYIPEVNDWISIIFIDGFLHIWFCCHTWWTLKVITWSFSFVVRWRIRSATSRHRFMCRECNLVNGQWFIVSYDSTNKQKHHKSHRMQ